MRQLGKRLHALRATEQRLGQHFARQMGVGDAVAGAALRIVNVVVQNPDLRQARERQQEVTRPREVNFHIFELREGFEHFRANDRFDIVRIARAVDHAAAVQQAIVSGDAIVVEQVIAVFHTLAVRNQILHHLVGQYLSGHHLRAAWHGFRRQFGYKIAQIGIARDHDFFRQNTALCGVHNR